MCFQQPKKWKNWLTAAEWWYNTNHHTALQMTPFQALYGYAAPRVNLLPMTSDTATASDWVQSRTEWNKKLKENLELAQNRMKQNADKWRMDKSFEVGNMVYLKLQPYRQSSVALRKINLKLSSKSYGPYKVLQKIGSVAYKLELPAGSLIHPVFHILMLKKSTRGAAVSSILPCTNNEVL